MGPTATKAVDSPTDLEYKAASLPAGAGGVISTDDETGVVEAIVAVTGVKDDQDDIIELGTPTKSIGRRTPKGVFSHDWKMWAARAEESRELPPGDPKLPPQTRDGQPWPADAGGLYVKHRYNLETQVGREAYANVKFFGSQCGWSIGYRVPKGGAVRGKDGIRRIRDIDIFEFCPVLFGAAEPAMTLSVKAAGAPADDAEDGEAADLIAQMHAAADAEIDWDGLAEATADVDDDDLEADAGTQGGAGGDDDGLAAPELTAEAAEAVEAAETGGEKTAFTAADRRKLAASGAAMSDGSYPIRNVADLKKAIKAYGRGATDPARAAAIRAHIIKRARALGRTDLVPEGWTGKGGTQSKAGTPGVADTPSDLRAVERLKDWYRAGADGQIQWGKPGDFAQCVAIAGKHLTPAKAKGLCANLHHDVTGEWPGRGAHGGDDHGKKDADTDMGTAGLLDFYSPAAEVGPVAGHLDPPQVDTKSMYPRLAGSYEDRQDAIREAVNVVLRGDLMPPPGGDGDSPEYQDGSYQWPDVSVDGTWPDHVIASRRRYRPDYACESYELDYTVDAAGRVTVGEPRPVHLVLTAAPGADPDTTPADAVPVADMVNSAATAAKSLTLFESKAGRVLSSANEARVRAAVEKLLEVLEAIGVHVDQADPTGSDGPATDGNDAMAGKIVITPDDLRLGELLVAAYARKGDDNPQ